MNHSNEVFPSTSLYAKDNHGTIRIWTISAHWSWLDQSKIIRIDINHGALGGSMSHIYELIEYGLAGRTIEEQALSRINSRINKKIDSGYVRSEEEARNNKRVNALGLHKPMLAAKYENESKRIPWGDGVYAQRKYNGHRCLITNVDGNLIAYSRNGKYIESIDHIMRELEFTLEEGETLDGELYHHGTPFQTISSWIKRKQPETKMLKYMVYDLISDKHYTWRLARLRNLLYGNEHSKVVPTVIVDSPESATQLLKQHRDEGYEGTMLRLPRYKYEDGKRSKSLIKMKVFHDDEFLVVGITPSSEGWAILNCVTEKGIGFDVSAPGNMDERFRVMERKGEYIGRYVNVQYAEWTLAGKPSHPVATAWRDKGAE